MNANKGIRFIRYSIGTVLALHGLAKLIGGTATLTYVGGMPPFAPHNSPSAQLVLGLVAAIFELVGGIGIATGYFYKVACWAAILLLAGAASYHLTQVSSFSTLMLNTWPIELLLVVIGLMIAGTAEKDKSE
jgi:uncharacterized membrane protein YphA (DoxX/SURF4 family)